MTHEAGRHHFQSRDELRKPLSPGSCGRGVARVVPLKQAEVPLVLTPAGFTDSRESTEAVVPQLAWFRYQLRQFLRFSEKAARAVGITAQRHQLLMGAAVGQTSQSLQSSCRCAIRR